MTDRELLEMAAKASGLNVRFNPRFCGGMGAWERDVRPVEPPLSEWLPWNPLTNDGDALRLAVILRLTVKIEDHEIEVFNWEGGLVSIGMFKGEDHYAATRRAIVRAAAEIGKQMP